MNEKIIIVPFLAGIVYLMVIVLFRGIKWIRGLSKIDKIRLFQSMKSYRLWQSLKEAFMEGLLHRKIFLKNPVLGYMHMSLAFGWFLLIVIGHLEVMVAEKSVIGPFYMPIFFRFFEHDKSFMLSGAFSFLMDLLLLFVLTGLSLAIIKRFKKQLFGMRKTTRLKTGDKFALTALWLIFPLRLLSESISAAQYHNGSFLTSGLGGLFENLRYTEYLQLPAWFAYSSALGIFFIALPNSRYMHIPTEILLIFLRNAGIRLKKRTNTFHEVQVYACSRCGICLDNCQLFTAGIRDTQSVYLLKSIRNRNLTDEQLFNCLLCGKCQTDCPVGISTIDLRISQRIESTLQYNSSYDYLEDLPGPTADLVYFAGCMTHLNPGIIHAMKSIFEAANEDYWFLDKDKAPCCGRPLMMAGQHEAASKLIDNITRKISGSGASRMVVSCPICYKVFKEDYDLQNVEVIFHAEYIRQLLKKKTIGLEKTTDRLIYHDPCELGRGMGIYEPPREVLKKAGTLVPVKSEKEQAHCCGGSLGNLKISQQERNSLRDQAVLDYLWYKPDLLVTACPMCKKTFSRNRNIRVKDLAEVVADAMHIPAVTDYSSQTKEVPAEQLVI
jgi:Fe-S oxidoreductase